MKKFDAHDQFHESVWPGWASNPVPLTFQSDVPPTVLGSPANASELTLKAPNENCSRRHFNVLLLSFKEIRLIHMKYIKSYYL